MNSFTCFTIVVVFFQFVHHLLPNQEQLVWVFQIKTHAPLEKETYLVQSMQLGSQRKHIHLCTFLYLVEVIFSFRVEHNLCVLLITELCWV